MVREFKNDMAKMFSLMERMDKHMTLSEAKYNDKCFMNEARNATKNAAATKQAANAQSEIGFNQRDPNDTTHRQPQFFLTVEVDHKQKARSLNIKLIGFTPQSINKLKNNGELARKGVTPMEGKPDENGNPNPWVLLTKQLPEYFDVLHRKDKTSSANNGVFDLDSALGSNALGVGDSILQEDDLDWLSAAIGGVDLDGGDNDAQGAEDIDDSFKGKQTKNDKDVYNWLKDVYKKTIDVLTDNGTDKTYSQRCVNDLYNIDQIFQIYLSQKINPKEAAMFVKKNAEDVNSEIMKAIKSGNYQNVLTSYINGPGGGQININNIIWGNRLTLGNAQRILQMAQVYGTQPTALFGRTMWKRYLGRSLKPGALPYPVEVPLNGRHDTTLTGTAGHAKGFNNRVNKFGTRYLYDISDTVLDDPNVDPYNNLGGVKNNITAELNDEALRQMGKIMEQVPEDMLEKAKKADTMGGKARIYNEALLVVPSQKNMNVGNLQTIDDADDDMTAINKYVANVRAIADVMSKAINYSNPAMGTRVAEALTFAILYYTTDVPNGVRFSTGDIKGAWKDNSSNFMGDLLSVVNIISEQVFNAFSDLREEIERLKKLENMVMPNAEEVADGNDDVTTTDDSEAVNEGINLEDIIYQILSD